MKSVHNERYVQIDFDEDRTIRERYLAHQNIPWTFKNLLPYHINVYMRRFTMTQLICSLAPNSSFSTTKTKNGLALQKDDAIHVMKQLNPLQNSKSAQQIEFARPVFLMTDSREVNIGDIVYEDRDSFTNGIDISHDMIGLRIHNHLTSGIDVYWKGLRIAQIAADDGAGYMSGSPNSVYLNNERAGFNVDDIISFSFTSDQKKYASIRLIDNWTSDIIVGQTTQKFVIERQDMYGYRVNSPNVNGLQYYDDATNGAYASVGRASGNFGPLGTNTRTDRNTSSSDTSLSTKAFMKPSITGTLPIIRPGMGATSMNLLKSQQGVKL